ncbi:hypothetical protein HW555_004761 [Spodoptera exigua]|uniref:Uncharacterized protein n=1 Tax=Spodoptera exigua TaxID=7107 RepID=A0A835GL36_SPOEX|nr:hypothetical protein HW555_004761 [Spodoptera exigua]
MICLNYSDDKENDNQDFYDNSRPSSPIQVPSVSADVSQSPLSPVPSSATNFVKENKTSHSPVDTYEIETAEKSIEPPPYSPLTPRPVIAKNNATYEIETAEKSIEPPPYSPLTPCPVTARNNATSAETFTSEKLIGTLADKTVSPLPSMSPETASLFNILADSREINSYYLNIEGVSDTSSITSLKSGDAPLFIDSDDSVKDPDYCAFQNYGSSGDSSNNSISLITGTAHAEINQTDHRINEIANCQIELINLGPLNAQQENMHDDSEMAFVLESDNGNGNNDSLRVKQPTGRPKRGRKPKYGGISREERKKRKYTNLSYVNSKKKIVSPKEFIDYECNCLKKCHENISVEKRLAQFKKFYSLGSYNAQNMFLTALINEQPVKRHYVATDNKTQVSKKKSYSRQYFLDGVSVCRDMFVKTLQTSAKRINTSLCKMRSDSCITDNRGLHGGFNRTPPESEEFVINLIKKLPTYISHYRRQETEGAKFLRPDMTLSKIYELQYFITKALMAPLWPTGKPVPDAKLKDLKSMLHLIPQDSHDFYVKLTGNEDTEDDIDGFSGQPDFELETDLD